MSNRVNLSNAFNTSLGFIPVIVSIILCGFIKPNTAIYIGAITGIIYSLISYYLSKEQIHNFILYSTTFVLCIISIITFFNSPYFPPGWIPISLEISVTIPLLILYIYKNKILIYYIKKNNNKAIEAAESSFIAIRVVLIFILFHFALITLCVMFSRSVNSNFMWVLLSVFPGLIFVGCIIFNQIGLNLFNKTVADVKYVPIINDKGAVIGKILEDEVPNRKNEVIIPVIRVTVEFQGMLYLCECFKENILCENKIDTPMETILYYKETLEDGVNRLLLEVFPTARKLKPRFNLKYRFKNDRADRIVFLFILSIKDDLILCDSRFESGKLWTLQQIEHNLQKNYFSEAFEHEYEHLKFIIDTIKKYKES